MKSLVTGALISGAMFLSSGAQAVPVSVGGVTWDTDTVTNIFSGTKKDFSGNGTVIETSLTQSLDNFVYGRGKVDYFNSSLPNQSSFCAGCELTYTFSMELDTLTPTGANSALFSFKNLLIKVFVDDSPNYTGSTASAADGQLWLELTARGFLSGSGENIGTGSDTGKGDALLDVTGGLAAAYFDTNTKLFGTDLVFSSSFQPAGVSEGGRPLLSGTFDLSGDTVPNEVPEPSSLALIGLGLIGLAGLRRRNKSA